LILSGCSSYLRSRSSGDAKSGVNIITSASQPVVTLGGNDLALTSALVFDGSTYNSPYKVYKYYLPKMSKSQTLNITVDNQTKTLSIQRQKDEGWFWIEGVIPWMYESIAGKLFYYEDVDISKIFKQN
jgi:hypothetical protein